MGALGWEISKSQGLVVIRGVGLFNLSFMTSFSRPCVPRSRRVLQALRLEVAQTFSSAATTSRPAVPHPLADPLESGPIAIMLGSQPSPLLIDMQVLLENLQAIAGACACSSTKRARLWPASEADPIGTRTGTPSCRGALGRASPSFCLLQPAARAAWRLVKKARWVARPE